MGREIGGEEIGGEEDVMGRSEGGREWGGGAGRRNGEGIGWGVGGGEERSVVSPKKDVKREKKRSGNGGAKKVKKRERRLCEASAPVYLLTHWRFFKPSSPIQVSFRLSYAIANVFFLFNIKYREETKRNG